MDINEGTAVEDLWTPYKELVAVVEGYLAHEGGGAPYAVHTFESVLRRHKQTFLSLLKNPPKNSTSREELRRGVTEGVNLPSIGRTLLSKELVDEAIIISDMYNVNEYLAVELLHTAQRQAARHPGLPRGLVAVLLYYDGRRAAAQAFRELVMARDGVSWSVSAREEIIAYVSRYVGALVADGALGGALDALRRFTLAAELELLQANRALPPRRHYARLVANIDTTRKLIAGVVFAASAQRGLNRDTLLRVLSEQSTSPTVGPTGALDEVSLALQMALLYALDLSVLHRREDGEELAKKLPLIQDPDLISVLIDELCPPSQAQGNQSQGQGQEPDKCPGVRALCQLALGLALAALKRAPQSLLKRNGNGAEIKMELLDQDEMLVDAAIDNKVFEYLDEAILSTEYVGKEEYYQRRVHSLLTDFIVLMHSKLMEMRAKADEAARAAQMYEAEGLCAPGAGRTRLHALLRCVERLYRRDPHRLRDDYWRACDPAAAHTPAHPAAAHSAHPAHPAAHTAAAHTARGERGGSGRAATLYKFVRLSGELVCAWLLPAYLRALAALAVERHTWALLARRDALCAHHLLTALARYHCNLRAEPGAFSSHSHSLSLGAAGLALGGAVGAAGGAGVARGTRLAVRRSELEGMAGALRLLAAVARQDAAAAAAIADNLQWDAVNCMFGLICCHVPIQLKAELCSTLAALGGWAVTAPRVWAALDAAQLVSASKDKRALYAELQEVECRMEEYPLSRAFLSLLAALCAAGPLPRALGAGARPPGLDPYLEHVLVRVALPAPHRAYATPHEKWQVLSLCFKLFAGWLEQYEPSAGEFGPEGALPPPPGARLLLQLHTQSELLRLLLASLDDAHAELERLPAPGAHTEYVEESLVLILQILERGLAMERALLDAVAEAPRPMHIIGLSKLILEPEGPDNTDRLVTCCKVLQHGASLPAAAARAVALLARALRPPAAAAHLLAAITDRRALAAEIRHGFVECLEAEEWGGGGGGEAEAAAVRQTREGIVSLLQQLLPGAPPNLALLLLGYPAGGAGGGGGALHEPGAAGHPRTCLHAVLDILDQHVAGHNAAQREASSLVEGCYRLVYWLCARPATSAATLRFLRARDHWLARHVRAHVHLQTASVVTLSARSWVLRACACEVGAAAAARHHPALGALLGALCGAGVGAGAAVSAGVGAGEEGDEAAWEWCLLRRALDTLPVSVRPVEEPRWELFHAHHLRQAIASCDLPTGMGGKRISVSRVHALLARELAGLHASAPQTNLVTIEIQKVLDYVTEVNRQRNLAATLTHYYDSWRQLTEILFCAVPHDVLPLDTRKSIILNILQDLLNKIPPAEVLPQLGNLASGTVLLLLVNLRHCYILQKRDSNLKSTDFETTFFGPSSQIMQTKSLTLKFILHKILSWILVSGGSTQKMRVNLYGALLNFLNIVNLKSSSAEPEEVENDSTYVSRLDSSKARPSKEESSLKSMVVDVISGFGDNLCAIVCGDSSGGAHDVCRMAALSCLDTLLELHPRSDWLHALADRGYLRSLIDSLLHDDEGLLEALEAQPRSLRAVYVYECKVALLLKLAASRAGAEAVLAQGALASLAGLRALSAHPDIHTAPAAAAAARHHTHFVPAVATRFRQMLVPALALCDALLTALGTQNHSCVIHVTHFLLSHVECVDMVLRAAHPNSGAGLLTEVEAVTSVVARASHRAVLAAVRAEPALRHAGAALRRLRALMLQLLPRFQLAAAAPAQRDLPDNRLHYKIVCNLLTYARNILEVGSSRVVFGPALGAREEGGGGGGGAGEGAADEGPELGALLQLLQGAVQALHHHRKLLATAQHQLHSVPTMTLDDLRKLIPESESESEAGWGAGVGGGVEPAAARGAGVCALRARLRVRRGEAALCAHALDLALYLVWAHVHVYLRAAAPQTQPQTQHDRVHSMDISLSKADALRMAGGEELPALRKGLVAVFNERFTEQLLDTAKTQPAQRGFLEVMVKDIKNMIQFSPL